MNISPTYNIVDYLPDLATHLAGQNIQSQISAAVLHQIQQQQEIQAAGIVKMMNATASLTGAGQIIDKFA